MEYSVIIPIYNSEKTLRRCVDSILAQNYLDVEIILVNDGSKDASLSICEEYVREYKNVRCLSQENAGVSAARNAGLNMARGEYVLFVDSDDYTVPEFFSIINTAVETSHADWIQFSSCVDNGREKHDLINKPYMSASRESLMPQIIDAICSKTINAPHAKLYKRSIIEKNCIRFPAGVSVAEDRAFNIVYSFYINSLIISNKVVYVINTENGESLSRKRHADLKDQFAIADAYIDRNFAEAPLSSDDKAHYCNALNFCRCRSIYHDAKLMIMDRIGWFDRQRQLMKICRKINGRHMKYPRNRYCTLISFPVRLYLLPVIDIIAWKLTRS